MLPNKNKFFPCMRALRTLVLHEHITSHVSAIAVYVTRTVHFALLEPKLSLSRQLRAPRRKCCQSRLFSFPNLSVTLRHFLSLPVILNRFSPVNFSWVACSHQQQTLHLRRTNHLQSRTRRPRDPDNTQQ